MAIKERLFNLIAKDSLAYSKPDNLFLFLANALGVKVERVKTEFNKLVANGDVFEVRKNKFITIPSRGYMKAKYIGNAKGFGFCEIGNDQEDIFIPGNKSNGAIDGDKVIVRVNAMGANPEGEVVAVYSPVKRVVGTIVKVSKTLFLDPDNTRISMKLMVRKSGLVCKENDKVVARIFRGEKGIITAEVIEILGQNDDVKTLELSIIRDHNLYEEFPSEVITASKKLPKKVLEKQKKGRLDLTKDVMFTIDGEDAKDFDDAVSIKRTKKGYLLGVHIADVGEYVKRGSTIDEEAYKRGTSTYFPTSVLPMLPVSLSNGICSLNEGVERLTLSCIMEVNKKGEVIAHKICESVIKSKARLTYTEVYATITGERKTKADKFKRQIMTMVELAEILEKNQKERGAIDLEIPEPKFVFDEKGYVVDVAKRERNIAHRLIEQFMILANETVAKEYCVKGFPFVYRVHEKPRPEKVRNVFEFIKGLGVKIPDIPEELDSDYFQKLLQIIEDKPFAETVNKVVLRSMQKARYLKDCLGHFGLALQYYCHFTSPIRRYPDLTIHRFIKESLHKKNITKTRREEMDEFADDSALQSSETEKNADRAERDVDDLWRAYLMKDRIGEVFDGIITSVCSYGFYVELENSVEGLVKIETLPLDNYLFFERSMMLKGERASFKIGDKVRVKLVESNIYSRRVTFELAF